ncbi:MAG: hypothetical protein Q4G28_10945 [Neisseria sp.]|nr:hypothetical protein [Neisseria sp.]
MYQPLKLAVFLLLAACGGEKADEAALQNHAREVVQLFFQSCVAHSGDGASVGGWAAQNGFAALDAAAVKKLPLGMIELGAQNVWRAEQGGAEYYLTWGRDGCGMKTPLADEAAVRSLFAEWAEKGGAGQTVRLRADNYSPSPFPFSQLVYSWQQGGEAVETLLSANTSPSKHVPAQAALNYSRAPMTAIPAAVLGQ